MSRTKERIAPPVRRDERSLFSQIVTPLNVTLLGGASLLLPLIEHQVATILFFILRPLTIPLAVIGAAAVVSLVVMIIGLTIGLRVRFLALGPVQVQTGGDAGWSLDINRAWRHYMGSVLLVPARGSYTRVQAIISAGTGLLTSAGILMLVSVYARSLGWPRIEEPGMNTQLETMLLAAPVGAGIVFLAELLTGGTVLSSILRGTPDQAQRMLANMMIASRMASGQRPRDWEPELVGQALSVPDSTADHLMGLCFAYLSAVDNGDLAAANQHLRAFERWLQESSSSVRPYVLSSLAGYASLYHERAWLTAAHRGDLDGASEYLNRAAGYDVARSIDLRVKAEILALEGDMLAAESAAQAGLDALGDFPVQEQWRIPFERDLLKRVLDRSTG